MRRSTQVSHSESFDTPPGQTFERVLTLPLQDVFRSRFLAIPPIRETRDQQGTWGTPGQTRTIVLADGGTMVERLVVVEPPSRFGYHIDGVTGPMKPLVASVDGTWSFAPEGEGTRITWEWLVHPTAVGVVAMPAFAAMWRGMARKAFADLRPQLG